MKLIKSMIHVGACLLFATAAQAETLRLTHNVSDTTTWQKGAEKFAELLSDATENQLKVRVFANSQLTGGDQIKQPEMVGRGSIDFMLTSAINVTPLVPQMAVFSLPYLYANYDEVDATTAGVPGQKMTEILAEKGIIVLAWGENGFREITNNVKPIKTPADLKGLKMRVAGPMYIDVMNALGANPQQMQWAETISALQQGVVDGQENPIGAVIVPQRIYEVQKYITTWHYSYDPIFLAVSEKKWKSWDSETQNKVRQAAIDAMVFQKTLTREDTASGLDKLRAEGMEVYEPSSEEIQAFRDATKAPFDLWAKKVGLDLVEVFQKAISESQQQ